MKLSVIIITRDEEKNIGRCLESVKWADEIIVVDALSRDRTVEIARKYTDRVVQRPWDGFANQREFALTLATCEFVLILDADEVLDDELQEEIKKIVDSKEVYSGYRIKFETYFLGKRLLFSDRAHHKLRLFLRNKGSVVPRILDECHTVKGPVKNIKGSIKHYTADTVSGRIAKINLYSSLWAEEKQKSGQGEKYLPVKAFYFFLRSFFGNFIIKTGFSDGFEGFVWCLLKAVENFLKYSKLWEISCKKN